ncbi:hypothetical protein D3C87_1185990 [compost metagenome]
MRQQVLRRARLAACGHVVRRGDEHARPAAQVARDEVGRQRAADAQRDVDALLARIDEAVVEHQLQFDVGVQPQELDRHRVEVPLPQRDRRTQAQQAARLLHLGARVGHGVAVVLEHAARAFMKALALLREAQARGRAPQQPHAQRSLQPGDQLAHGGLRGVERAGRAREAAEFDAVHEGGECAKGVHGVIRIGNAMHAILPSTPRDSNGRKFAHRHFFHLRTFT